MDQVAEQFLTNQLNNVRMELVSLVLYNETEKLAIKSEDEIREQMQGIIEKRFASFDKSKIDLSKNPILERITYIVFPIWEFEQLAREFQDLL